MLHAVNVVEASGAERREREKKKKGFLSQVIYLRGKNSSSLKTMVSTLIQTVFHGNIICHEAGYDRQEIIHDPLSLVSLYNALLT